eukprot:TRINITY_DN1923_c0_g1_i6.p4 TRINITY_DN1923_c0_g1~~TRINITY_DN1923_c0_g1_i6.p4  ORF type:complete len:133 (+),score=8.73 TRINITY_DN1923_c0_g1_i6:2012-2410(+)
MSALKQQKYRAFQRSMYNFGRHHSTRTPVRDYNIILYDTDRNLHNLLQIGYERDRNSKSRTKLVKEPKPLYIKEGEPLINKGKALEEAVGHASGDVEDFAVPKGTEVQNHASDFRFTYKREIATRQEILILF